MFWIKRLRENCDPYLPPSPNPHLDLGGRGLAVGIAGWDALLSLDTNKDVWQILRTIITNKKIGFSGLENSG